jgi:hypothetical protein
VLQDDSAAKRPTRGIVYLPNRGRRDEWRPVISSSTRTLDFAVRSAEKHHVDSTFTPIVAGRIHRTGAPL